jgi:hypothetical protein
MKVITTALMVFGSYLAHSQILKTIGIKSGITRSYFTWNYRESSATNPERDKSDKAIGLAFLLTADVIDKKYWSVNLAAGWLAGWLERNAQVKYEYLYQGSYTKSALDYKTSYLTNSPQSLPFRGLWR